MRIIIDCGHDYDCPNCSPDGSFIESHYVRLVGTRLAELLDKSNMKYSFVSHKTMKVSLQDRVLLANRYYSEDPNCYYLSIHTNASGNSWTEHRGLITFVSSKASKRSIRFAQEIQMAASRFSVPRNKYFDQCGDFYVLNKTKCPAVLVELGFHTNQLDVHYMRTHIEMMAQMLFRACDQLRVI